MGLLGEDYSPDVGNGPPPLGGAQPVETVLAQIQRAADAPSPHSVSFILRSAHEQTTLRPGRFSFGWFILWMTVILGGIAMILRSEAPAMMWVLLLTAPPFAIYQALHQRQLLEQHREEATAIMGAAVEAIISLSKHDMVHKNLHRDRIKLAKGLIRRGGEDYRTALAKILDNAAPEEPLVVSSSL